MNQIRLQPNVVLTEREKEVLRWIGSDKTPEEIGKILKLGHSTINFHIRNTMYKLNAPNKASAISKAIYLRLLY